MQAKVSSSLFANLIWMTRCSVKSLVEFNINTFSLDLTYMIIPRPVPESRLCVWASYPSILESAFESMNLAFLGLTYVMAIMSGCFSMFFIRLRNSVILFDRESALVSMHISGISQEFLFLLFGILTGFLFYPYYSHLCRRTSDSEGPLVLSILFLLALCLLD